MVTIVTRPDLTRQSEGESENTLDREYLIGEIQGFQSDHQLSPEVKLMNSPLVVGSLSSSGLILLPWLQHVVHIYFV